MRNTPARKAMLKIFSESAVPLDAEAVGKKLSRMKGLGNTNEATIYRNLSAMEKNSILEQVDVRKDATHFELKDKHHHHIVCTNCDTIEDFANKEIENVLGSIVRKSSGFKNITKHSLELFGLCRECA